MLAELERFYADYCSSIRREADALRGEQMPPVTEELFAIYENTGNRLKYESVYFLRRKYLAVFGLKGILDGEERDIRKLEEVIRDICGEECWALPAHVNRKEDENWRNYIDLFAAETAQTLAGISGLLKGRLSAGVLETVRREVMRRAAEHLTPVTLELGGKSPCIVDRTANIPLAAKRIVFGKFLNCGQTCVAPDYIYCDETVKPALLRELKKQVELQYGREPLKNENYGKIINRKHFDRICGLIEEKKVVYGGERNADTRQIAPVVMDGVSWEDAVMGEEIFGPVLPVLSYRSLEEAVRKIRSMPCPLALYLFSASRRNISYVKERVSFGGGCINDTLIHLATSAMGFGGVGESGMGSYHGKHGFETFTHRKSIVDKKTFPDLPMRYQPYAAWKDKMIRMFVK